jgi:acylphosphatase
VVMDKRLKARISGLVQGVSFRYYTQREARRLGLTGWVANRPDGSVELVAEGPEKQISAFSHFLLRGSPFARVDEVKADWLDPTGEFSEFSIRYI